ncbi:FecR family protein [Parabacteroides pacaensis]|uniref:FecR family protein n=1 Tax=Parabacteroides pacaensis TaxID=2086575 RepID=UPI000D0F0F70|nr:FecR domain-containing protein [Parabacteroides pacaensis]
MNRNEKNILKKLLYTTLSPVEKETLLSRPSVDTHFREQWMDAPDFARQEKVNEHKIWVKIYNEIWGNKKKIPMILYKFYSIAASVLLLLGLSGGAYYWVSHKTTQVMYITTSGVRNIESVVLPDGSTVQLGPSSKLTYPDKFATGKRIVELSGQAFFDVAKDKTKPFIVHSKDMEVTALGTAFEVFNYDQENKIETILLQGKVKIDLTTTSGKIHKKDIYLSPNEKLTFIKDSRNVVIETVDADKYTSWRSNGILSFENEKLSMIIPRLEQWYGRKIICQKDLADTYRFTFKVRDESLKRILFILGKSSPLTYREVGENYQLYLKR